MIHTALRYRRLLDSIASQPILFGEFLASKSLCLRERKKGGKKTGSKVVPEGQEPILSSSVYTQTHESILTCQRTH